MDSDSECAAAAIVVAVLLKRRKRSKHKKRSAWVKPWLQKQTQFGIYDTLLQELRLQEEEDYKKFLRMSTDTFNELLQLISNDIQKQDTVMRASIPPKIKLELQPSDFCQLVLTTLIFSINLEYIRAL